MQKINVALVCAAAFTLTAFAESYNYTPGETSLGNGAVTITYDGDTTDIATLTANPSNGETITLTGGAATFAAGATITLASSGTVSFAEKVTTKGALTIVRGDDAYCVWTGSALTDGLTKTGVAAAFRGLGRDDLVDSSIVVVGAADGPCPGRFHYVDGPGSGIYTLNNVRPDYTFSIRPQLSQANGIITEIRCITGSRSSKFAEWPDKANMWPSKSLVHYCSTATATGNNVTRIDNVSAMKLTKIIIRRKGMAEKVWVRFDGGATLGGTTSIGVGVEAVLAASKGSDAAILDYPITGDGDFRIVTRTSATGASAYFEPFITTTSWQVLAENCSLSALSSLSGRMLGGSHNYSDYTSVGGTPCDAYWIKYDPVTDTATCQFQWGKSDYANVKVVKASLKQNGANVEIKATSAGYKPKSSNPLGSDFSSVKLEGSVATSVDTSGYGIHMITATFAGVANKGVAQLNSTMNTMFGSMLTFDGSNGPLYATVTNKNAFPICGAVNIGTNADVSLHVKGMGLHEGISGGSSRLCVQRGGILRRGIASGNGQIGVYQDFVIDGGIYSSEVYNVYQNFVTLMNGGRITGDIMPRTVYGYSPHYWRVRGTSPSFIDNGINVFGAAGASDGKSKRFLFDVADVTGNDDVDCTVAKITNTDSPAYRFPYFRFEKLGAGTMLLAGDGKDMRLETFVSGGTFLLGASEIVTNEFVLCGGNLAAVAGAQNNLGALTVSNACTITVGAGGSLTFASFAPDANLAAKSIMIDAPQEGATIKFKTALTDEQLRYFRWKDDESPVGSWRVEQDSDGLHPLKHGITIYIR